jgi:hypothetical protein
VALNIVLETLLEIDIVDLEKMQKLGQLIFGMRVMHGLVMLHNAEASLAHLALLIIALAQHVKLVLVTQQILTAQHMCLTHIFKAVQQHATQHMLD